MHNLFMMLAYEVISSRFRINYTVVHPCFFPFLVSWLYLPRGVSSLFSTNDDANGGICACVSREVMGDNQEEVMEQSGKESTKSRPGKLKKEPRTKPHGAIVKVRFKILVWGVVK